MENRNNDNSASTSNEMRNYKTDATTVQGYSHLLIDKECQDVSLAWQTNKYCAIIVCDGHGGEKYIRSRTGAELACAAGREMIDGFMSKISVTVAQDKGLALNDKTFDPLLSQLERSILQKWRFDVENDYRNRPLGEDSRFKALPDNEQEALRRNPVKAYGTTFIAAVVMSKGYFIMKLGDGDVNVIRANRDVFWPPELADDQLAFNVTTSMCNSDADVSFHHCFRYDGGRDLSGIVLTSDGVKNCYPSESKYVSLVLNAFDAYGEERRDAAHRELEGVLHQLSEKGSGDDLSLAIIRKKIN